MLEAVQTATLDLSVSQTSQLTMTVKDEDLALLKAGWAKPGTSLTYGGMGFSCRVYETVKVGSVPALSVTARSLGVVKMQGLKGTLVRSNLSPTDYVRMDATGAGLTFVGQPTAVRAQIVRTNDGTTNESAWDVAGRLASEEGFFCFESKETVYFGQPSWLVKVMPRYRITWPPAESDVLASYPDLRDSVDDNATGATGSFTVHPDWAETFIPGVVVEIAGMGMFDQAYLVSELNFQLDGMSPPTVSIAAPVDPVPNDATTTKNRPANSATFSAVYPSVAPGPVSLAGFTWPATGTVRGSTATGVSIYAPVGSQVSAPQGGTVTKAEGQGPAGYKVRIDHGAGISSEMTHLGSLAVRVGQAVGRGQRIGSVGQQAPSDAYMHVQVFTGTTSVPPMNYLPAL